MTIEDLMVKIELLQSRVQELEDAVGELSRVVAPIRVVGGLPSITPIGLNLFKMSDPEQ